MKAKCTIFLVAIVMFVKISSVLQPTTYVEANTDSIKKEIAETQLSIEQAVKEQTEIEGEIMHLHGEIGELDIEIEEVNKQILDYDEKLTFLISRMSEYERDLERQQEFMDQIRKDSNKIEEEQIIYQNYFKERARIYHQSSQDANYLEVLLGSQSFSNFVNRVVAYRQIVDFDTEIFGKYEDSMERLSNVERELLIESQKLREQKEQLQELNLLFTGLQKDRQIYMEEVQKDLAEKRKALQAHESHRAEAARKELQLKEELKRREDLLRQAQVSKSKMGVSVAQGQSGMFIIPTNGTFTSGFGSRWGRIHNGIDIANSIGTPVVASATGTIKWAQYVNGYGNTVLISHKIDGRIYETLYAHLNSINVKVGQSVSQGQNIGEMGNTGESTGPHLHFEVHMGVWNSSKSNAIDPLSLLSS